MSVVHHHPSTETGTLRDLTPDECWALVGSRQVGRLVWHGHDGLTAVPLTFVVDGGALRMRVMGLSSITRECDASPVAFEVDSLDPATHSGWSVLLRGLATVSFDLASASSAVRPWPSGPRAVELSLDVDLITGRRLAA